MCVQVRCSSYYLYHRKLRRELELMSWSSPQGSASSAAARYKSPLSSARDCCAAAMSAKPATAAVPTAAMPASLVSVSRARRRQLSGRSAEAAAARPRPPASIAAVSPPSSSPGPRRVNLCANQPVSRALTPSIRCRVDGVQVMIQGEVPRNLICAPRPTTNRE